MPQIELDTQDFIGKTGLSSGTYDSRRQYVRPRGREMSGKTKPHHPRYAVDFHLSHRGRVVLLHGSGGFG